MKRHDIFLSHRTQDEDAETLARDLRSLGYSIYLDIWDPKTGTITASSEEGYRDWLRAEHLGVRLSSLMRGERTMARYIADVISGCTVQVVKGHADLDTAWIGYEIGLVKAAGKVGCLYQYRPAPRSVFNALDRPEKQDKQFAWLVDWLGKNCQKKGERR